MTLSVEKYISNFIKNQFPSFYETEGPTFVLFLEAYYEWLENHYTYITTYSNSSFILGDNVTGNTSNASGEIVYANSSIIYVKTFDTKFVNNEIIISQNGTTNKIKSASLGSAIHESRNLFDYRDIDTTLTNFLEHFQQKYLYGIPYNIISNKRFLLKHIQDIYRSKGTNRCYDLLFKLIYNEEIDIYTPSYDVLRISDGTWVQPKYIEVTDSTLLANITGQLIKGVSSQTQGIVEKYIKEPINDNIINTLYVSNINPPGASFEAGEKILIYPNANNYSVFDAPTVTGSLSTLKIVTGGDGFNVGDILKIAERDIETGQRSSYGVEGKIRVSNTARSQGSLEFFIDSSGSGYTQNSSVFFYTDTFGGDLSGHGASFGLGPITYVQRLRYNTDLFFDYADTKINATSYEFPLNPSANLQYTIESTLSYSIADFGSITSLTNINAGNNYILAPIIQVRSLINSKPMPGSVSFAAEGTPLYTGPYVQGFGTSFTTDFSVGDAIGLSVSKDSPYIEYQLIADIVSDDVIVLLGGPTISAGSLGAYYRVADILPSNYALYDQAMITSDGTVKGRNALITGIPNTGNNIVSEVQVYDSGKGYVEGELVTAYLFNGLTTPLVSYGGTGYAQDETLTFIGGTSSTSAEGFIGSVNSTGGIIQLVLTNPGANYSELPIIKINTESGSGAVLTTSISAPNNYNTLSKITGTVIKSGTGKGPGYWSTTQGFLDSDKYIQDSYFYQDFSYQIKAANILNNYKQIIYDTFHTSGYELFGSYQALDSVSSINSILFEVGRPIFEQILSCDTTTITSDSNNITCDKYYTSYSA